MYRKEWINSSLVKHLLLNRITDQREKDSQVFNAVVSGKISSKLNGKILSISKLKSIKAECLNKHGLFILPAHIEINSYDAVAALGTDEIESVLNYFSNLSELKDVKIALSKAKKYWEYGYGFAGNTITQFHNYVLNEAKLGNLIIWGKRGSKNPLEPIDKDILEKLKFTSNAFTIEFEKYGILESVLSDKDQLFRQLPEHFLNLDEEQFHQELTRYMRGNYWCELSLQKNEIIECKDHFLNWYLELVKDAETQLVEYVYESELFDLNSFEFHENFELPTNPDKSPHGINDSRHLIKDRGGRPAKYDWDAFDREIVRLAVLDGFELSDDGKRNLVKIMTDWVAENWENQPDLRLIRGQVEKKFPR